MSDLTNENISNIINTIKASLTRNGQKFFNSRSEREIAEISKMFLIVSENSFSEAEIVSVDKSTGDIYFVIESMDFEERKSDGTFLNMLNMCSMFECEFVRTDLIRTRFKFSGLITKRDGDYIE